MDDKLFDKLQKQMHDAVGDIASAYAAAGRVPDENTVIAFADLFDCSPNEFRRLMQKKSGN